MVSVPQSQWPLVSRESELTAFDGVWGTSRCQCVVVCGPAGVGKSRLAEEFAARAVTAGALVGRATASAAAAAVPLGAIAHLIPPTVDMTDPVQGFAQVARALTEPEQVSRRPAVLLLDDLHLLDATSVMLLRQLLDAAAVRLIATVRTGGPVNESVGALMAGDAVHRIDLEAFTREQVETVLRAALGGAVARQTVHELDTGSGGNALYLRELVLGALHDSALSWDGEIWQLTGGRPAAGTARLTELIGARMAGVGPSALTVLELLAVCGPVSLADAEAAAGDPTVLPDLERAGLVRVIIDGRRTAVQPAHPLYAEVLRARLPVLRRRALLTAQIERARAHDAGRRDDPLRIAAWQLAAGGGADPALLIQAAALARYAHDYPQARILLDALPEQDHTNATRVMFGEVLYQLGESDRAEQVFAEADALADGDQEILTVTLARSFSLFWLAARARDAFAVNDASRARIRDEAALRMLRYNEGSMLIASGDLLTGLELLRDMEADVHHAPNSTAWLMGATMKSLALGLTGRTETEVRLTEGHYAASRAVHDRSLFPHPATQLIQLSLAFGRRGDLNRAREVGERGHTELITTAATPLTTLWTALALGDVESRAGHPAAARRWFAEAIALARAHHFVTPLHPALSGLAVSAALLGDHDAADQAAAEAAGHPPLGLYRIFEYLVPAWLAACRGRLDEARAILADGAAKAAQHGMITTEAMLLTDIARLGGAAEVADRLADLVEEVDGAFAPARANFAAALATDDPDRLLGAAHDLAVIGADLMAAEAATAAAAACRRTGDTRRAAAAAQEARIHLARCGEAHTPLLALAEAAGSLTARERDVALMAGHGTSSQDIADALNLSVRTVENHLHRAYTKLGVTSRRELAQVLGSNPGS